MYSVWRLKAAFQCILWEKKRGGKNRGVKKRGGKVPRKQLIRRKKTSLKFFGGLFLNKKFRLKNECKLLTTFYKMWSGASK